MLASTTVANLIQYFNITAPKSHPRSLLPPSSSEISQNQNDQHHGDEDEARGGHQRHQQRGPAGVGGDEDVRLHDVERRRLHVASRTLCPLGYAFNPLIMEDGSNCREVVDSVFTAYLTEKVVQDLRAETFSRLVDVLQPPAPPRSRTISIDSTTSGRGRGGGGGGSGSRNNYHLAVLDGQLIHEMKRNKNRIRGERRGLKKNDDDALVVEKEQKQAHEQQKTQRQEHKRSFRKLIRI